MLPPNNNDTAPGDAPPQGSGAGAAPLLGTADPPPAGAAEWLPEAYRGNDLFKSFKGIDDLAKSYDHAARLVGVDKAQVLRIPKDGDAAAMGQVFAALGRPEKPDGYQLPELPGLIEGVDAAAREAFHAAGLSGKQASAVMEMYGAQVQRAQELRAEQAAQIEAGVVADLKREWGDGFDDRVHAANRAIMELGGAELSKVLATTQLADGTYLGNHPALLRLFARLGEQSAEPGNLAGLGGRPGEANFTAETARAEIDRLVHDRDFQAARRDRGHPDHAKNVARWDRLHQVAVGGAGKALFQ